MGSAPPNHLRSNCILHLNNSYQSSEVGLKESGVSGVDGVCGVCGVCTVCAGESVIDNGVN